MTYRTDKLMIDGQTHIHTHAGNNMNVILDFFSAIQQF